MERKCNAGSGRFSRVRRPFNPFGGMGMSRLQCRSTVLPRPTQSPICHRVPKRRGVGPFSIAAITSGNQNVARTVGPQVHRFQETRLSAGVRTTSKYIKLVYILRLLTEFNDTKS